MPKYQVIAVERPENWTPRCLDDAPAKLSEPLEVLCESDDLFAAVDRAIEQNDGKDAQRRRRWAVVVEPGTRGLLSPNARLCTPVAYKVTALWWPDGWEPHSPLDVPNCAWQAREDGGGESLSYPQAEAMVLALNRQCIEHPGANWHVVVAIENEPLSRTMSYDSSGVETVTEVRRMHVIRPAEGGHGDCSHCPAGTFPCAKAEWSSQPQTVSARHSRAFGC
jgi:hypothetical protein